MTNKFWLWKNFVNGNPEYWMFDNPFPCHENGDPMTLGEPCGYAIFKASTQGRHDKTYAEVIDQVKRAQSNKHPDNVPLAAREMPSPYSDYLNSQNAETNEQRLERELPEFKKATENFEKDMNQEQARQYLKNVIPLQYTSCNTCGKPMEESAHDDI